MLLRQQRQRTYHHITSIVYHRRISEAMRRDAMRCRVIGRRLLLYVQNFCSLRRSVAPCRNDQSVSIRSIAFAPNKSQSVVKEHRTIILGLSQAHLFPVSATRSGRGFTSGRRLGNGNGGPNRFLALPLYRFGRWLPGTAARA